MLNKNETPRNKGLKGQCSSLHVVPKECVKSRIARLCWWALLSASLHEFSHSLIVGMALEQQVSAKPPQTQQKQIPTPAEQGLLDAEWELFGFLVD